MWGKRIQDRFDAGAWSGQFDLTRAVVTFSMLAGVGLLWLGVAIVIMLQI